MATPLITRLYLPADYGLVAIYASIVTIAAAVAGGRYESAVTLPAETAEGEGDAIGLVRVANVCALLVAGFSLFAVTAAKLSGAVVSLNALGVWAYAIPLGILLSACSATLSSYATRRRRYGAIARITPLQKSVSAGVQLIAGYLKFGLTGLMIGAIVTPFVGLGVLMRVYLAGRRDTPGSTWNWVHMWGMARKYSDFPRISTWFALLNALSWNVQAIVLARYYSIADVGQYALASAMITLPTSLVLTGVSQVYLRESAARVADQAAVLRLARRTLSALFAASVPLFLALFLTSKYLFELIFGVDWVTAGVIATAMIPLAWSRFLTTSLTASFNVYRRQGTLLAWQGVSFVATLGSLIFGGSVGLSIAGTTLLTSIMVAPLYMLLLPVTFRVIRSGVSD